MNNSTNAITAARQAHSSRCRQRVLTALKQAADLGAEISISSVARHAGVDRSFLYRHRDLHAAVLAKAGPPTAHTGGPAASRSSLLADLANAHDRITRLARENTQLRQRLPEHLGEQAWRESGLGAPEDIDHLQRRITELEQKPQSNTVSSQTATTNSTRREPPTANSWPNSTVPTRPGAVTRPAPVAHARVSSNDA